MIFSDMIDRNIGSMPCWISSCCAPSLPWLSAAAFTERLNLTQSTVSQQIKRLELETALSH
jgi:hypothetical protein